MSAPKDFEDSRRTMSTEPTRRFGLTGGVVDAAMSSLATFAAALVAARILSDTQLGVYAVFYTAFNFGQVIANNLVYIPAEVIVVSWPVAARLRALKQTTRLAIGPSLAGAAAIAIATLIAAQVAEAAVVMPLTITAAITTFFWPTQDHVRRMLHIAELSWHAAAVSVVQFVTVIGAIAALMLLDVPAAWIPYGSLGIANGTSLITGLALARHYHIRTRRRDLSGRGDPIKLRLRELIQAGSWLLAGVGAPTLAAMGAATIITFAAGSDILGYAEAARIVAQPVLVLGTGLGYVLGPRLMRAAIARKPRASRAIHLRFNAIVIASASAYAVVAAWKWPGNPMSTLVPNAFEVEWLVPATIAAHVVMAAVVLLIQELLAVGQARLIGIVGMLSAPLQLLAAATAGVTGAFARPLSMAAGSGARLYANGRSAARIYKSGK
jgi:O-antigen/teichoic acid export membrane protein